MKNYILLIFILSTMICFSQKNVGDDINMGLPDFTPVSPNAASLGNFGNIPVGLNTGNPNISIPIYTIEMNDFNFPISLNYSSNGLKVDERESVVGMGWSLINCGVISRQQNDAADHPDLSRILLPDYNYSSENMRLFLESINNPESNSRDIQPDIFSFNVNGLSGKFYLDEDWNPVKLEPSANKIEVLESFYNEQLSGPSFLITSGDGTKYYFGTITSRESSFTRNSCNGIPSEIIINSWYLSKVVLPSGKCLVFTYETKVTEYITSISQNFQASVTHKIPSGYIAPETWTYNIPNGNSSNLCTLKGNHTASYLKKIQFDGSTIDFCYSNMYSSSISKQLQKVDSIIIKNKNDHKIKTYHLLYEEYEGLLEYNNNEVSFSDSTIYKRSFLKELKNNTGSEESSHYFEYIQPELLAPRLSFAQDYWGFFNGKDNNTLITDNIDEFGLNFGVRQFFPAEQVNQWFSSVGSNKRADFEYGSRGMLKQVIYPTGGVTKLKYEPHSVRKTNFIFPSISSISLSVLTEEEWPIGGVIDSFFTDTIKFSQEGIRFTANVNKNYCWQEEDPNHWVNMTLKIYDVTSDSNVRVYKWVYGNKHYIETPLIIEDYTDQYYLDIEEGHVYYFEVKLIRPCLAGGFSIWYYNEDGQYNRVNEQIGGCRIKQTIDSGGYNNENLITNYYYGYLDSLNTSSGHIVPFRSSISTYYSHLIEQLEPNTSMINEIHTYTYNLSSSSLYSLFSKDGNHILYENIFIGKGVNNHGGLSQYKYNAKAYDADPIVICDEQIPGTPLINNFVSGELLEKVNYNKNISGYSIKDKTIYNYSFNDGYNGSAKYFNTSQSQKLLQVNYYNLNTYFINNKWRILSSEDRFEYDDSGNEIKSIHTDYQYANPEHYQITNKSTYTSNGNIRDINYFYPKDFNATVENYQTLNNSNIISKPVKTNILVNDKVIDSKIASYNDFGQLIELSFYENNSLIDEPTHNPNHLTTIPQYYSTFASQLYDPESNTVKQINFRNKPTSTILWGYNYSYVIAIIENASYIEIENILPCSYSDLQTKTNEELNTLFNSIRISNPQLNITNYTYQPLVGILSITDINGKKTEYDYDSLNRLRLIKDVDDDWVRIQKKIEYNYLDF